MKNTILIEKIFVCRTKIEDKDIVEKALIQYSDGSYDYIQLPPRYDKMNMRKKRQSRILLESKLSSWMKNLSAQYSSYSNDLENGKVLIITDKDVDLKQYVDDIIEREIDKLKQSREHVNLINSIYLFALSIMNFNFAKNTFLPTSEIEGGKAFIGYEVAYLIPYSVSLIASINANLCNKKRKLQPSEYKIVKRLKLYLSYLMIILNIGLNISNLNINYEKFARLPSLVTLEKKKMMRINILKNLDNPFSDPNHFVTTTEAEVNLLMEAFQNNPMLEDTDVEIALALKKYLEENPYCNYEELYQEFATLITINDSHRYTVTGNNYNAAEYNREENIITMYVTPSKKHYIGGLEHELIHKTGYLDNIMLNEGMASLIQAEYMNYGMVSDAYYDHVLMTKIFCELITPKKMLEAYSKRDMSIIKQEMLKINSNEEDYNNLMNAMQEYGNDFHDGVNNQFRQKYEDISTQFYILLTPYLNSNHIKEDHIIRIMAYIEDFGKSMNARFATYFNHDCDISYIPPLDLESILMPKK